MICARIVELPEGQPIFRAVILSGVRGVAVRQSAVDTVSASETVLSGQGGMIITDNRRLDNGKGTQ